jgi:hypothetical protein
MVGQAGVQIYRRQGGGLGRAATYDPNGLFIVASRKQSLVWMGFDVTGLQAWGWRAGSVTEPHSARRRTGRDGQDGAVQSLATQNTAWCNVQCWQKRHRVHQHLITNTRITNRRSYKRKDVSVRRCGMGMGMGKGGWAEWAEGGAGVWRTNRYRYRYGREMGARKATARTIDRQGNKPHVECNPRKQWPNANSVHWAPIQVFSAHSAAECVRRHVRGCWHT